MSTKTTTEMTRTHVGPFGMSHGWHSCGFLNFGRACQPKALHSYGGTPLHMVLLPAQMPSTKATNCTGGAKRQESKRRRGEGEQGLRRGEEEEVRRGGRRHDAWYLRRPLGVQGEVVVGEVELIECAQLGVLSTQCLERRTGQ